MPESETPQGVREGTAGRCQACGGEMTVGEWDGGKTPVCLACPLPVALLGQAGEYPTDLIDTDEARALLGAVSREILDELVAAKAFRQYRITARVIRYSRWQVLAHLIRSADRGQAECDKKVSRRKAAATPRPKRVEQPKRPRGRPRKHPVADPLSGVGVEGREVA